MNSNNNFCNNTLLKNLDEFRIADTDATFRFYHKLADENNWSRKFSRRVIHEYKKFLYLATVHGPVTPSKVVDVAWHLHLTYTHSYWIDCVKKYCDIGCTIYLRGVALVKIRSIVTNTEKHSRFIKKYLVKNHLRIFGRK